MILLLLFMIFCSWNIQLFFPCWPPHFRPRSPWDLSGSMVGTQPSGGRGVRRPGDALISMAFPWVSTGFLWDFYRISMGFLWVSMGFYGISMGLMRFIDKVSKYSMGKLWFHSDNWRLLEWRWMGYENDWNGDIHDFYGFDMIYVGWTNTFGMYRENWDHPGTYPLSSNVACRQIRGNFHENPHLVRGCAIKFMTKDLLNLLDYDLMEHLLLDRSIGFSMEINHSRYRMLDLWWRLITPENSELIHFCRE